MNTWIFDLHSAAKRVIWALALCCAGACSQAPDLAETVTRATTRKAPDRIAVAGGEIFVAGPKGYCIDRSGSELRGGTAFVLLGSCAAISRNDTAEVPDALGLLTASVERRSGETPSIDALIAYLTSKDGRAALARDGLAPSVEVHSSEIEQDAVLLYLNDSSVNPTPGLQSTYWRGVFALHSRLVSVTVIGFESRPLPADIAREKLIRFISRIRTETKTAAPNEPEKKSRRQGNGLFRNILR